jgi:hypothetical protein
MTVKFDGIYLETLKRLWRGYKKYRIWIFLIVTAIVFLGGYLADNDYRLGYLATGWTLLSGNRTHLFN